jgi:hypothetical protein
VKARKALGEPATPVHFSAGSTAINSRAMAVQASGGKHGGSNCGRCGRASDGSDLQGPGDRTVLALTIDEFPSSGTDLPGSGTMELLDLFGELAIPATLFVIGERVREHSGMAARAVEGGHEFGNQLWRNPWSFKMGG